MPVFSKTSNSKVGQREILLSLWLPISVIFLWNDSTIALDKNAPLPIEDFRGKRGYQNSTLYFKLLLAICRLTIIQRISWGLDPAEISSNHVWWNTLAFPSQIVIGGNENTPFLIQRRTYPSGEVKLELLMFIRTAIKNLHVDYF